MKIIVCKLLEVVSRYLWLSSQNANVFFLFYRKECQEFEFQILLKRFVLYLAFSYQRSTLVGKSKLEAITSNNVGGTRRVGSRDKIRTSVMRTHLL